MTWTCDSRRQNFVKIPTTPKNHWVKICHFPLTIMPWSHFPVYWSRKQQTATLLVIGNWKSLHLITNTIIGLDSWPSVSWAQGGFTISFLPLLLWSLLWRTGRSYSTSNVPHVGQRLPTTIVWNSPMPELISSVIVSSLLLPTFGTLSLTLYFRLPSTFLPS